jgi:hypothetical protein
MQTIADVKAHANKRLADLREQNELENRPDAFYLGVRSRIAELKDLLVALEAKAPPVWTDTAEAVLEI